MTTTTGVTNGSSAASAAQAASANDPNALGEGDFLKLLSAQLANQDPTQPVDNQAFVAQLAQFSSLQQLQDVSSQLGNLLTATATSTQVEAAALVGKTVTYNASSLALTSGQPANMQVQLGGQASVTAVIQNASGQTVRTLALGSYPAGSFSFSWDGLDANGNALPSGSYGVSLTATGPSGAAVGAQARAQGTVQGVQLGSGGTTLVVGGSNVNLSDVLEITQS